MRSSPHIFPRQSLAESEYRMATGLGMTDAEWEDLKSQVDDSFWVMRIIGLLAVLLALPTSSP